MVLKTFNVSEKTYKKFSTFCKSRGLSMSKQVDFFIKSVVSEEPEAREEYLEKLDEIRKQKSSELGSISDFKRKYDVK